MILVHVRFSFLDDTDVTRKTALSNAARLFCSRIRVVLAKMALPCGAMKLLFI
jgi:hypothetical protein